MPAVKHHAQVDGAQNQNARAARERSCLKWAGEMPVTPTPNITQGVMLATNTFPPPLRELLQNRAMRPILRLALRSRDQRTGKSLPSRFPKLT